MLGDTITAAKVGRSPEGKGDYPDTMPSRRASAATDGRDNSVPDGMPSGILRCEQAEMLLQRQIPRLWHPEWDGEGCFLPCIRRLERHAPHDIPQTSV